MILGEHFAKDLSIRSKVGFRNLEVASVGFGSWAFGRFWGLWGLRGFGGHPSQIEGVCQEGVAAVGGGGGDVQVASVKKGSVTSCAI